MNTAESASPLRYLDCQEREDGNNHIEGGGQGKPIPGNALLLSFVPYAWVIPWSVPRVFGTARGAKHIGDT